MGPAGSLGPLGRFDDATNSARTAGGPTASDERSLRSPLVRGGLQAGCRTKQSLRPDARNYRRDRTQPWTSVLEGELFRADGLRCGSPTRIGFSRGEAGPLVRSIARE